MLGSAHSKRRACLCLRATLLPLPGLLVLEGEVLPPVVLVNNSTFPGSRMSSQEKKCRFENSDLFPPEYVLPNLVKISCWGKPEGLDSFLQCECFQTKRASQMLDRWQCPLRKNERKLFNMSDYRLFRNFMWTFLSREKRWLIFIPSAYTFFLVFLLFWHFENLYQLF